jgi:hypothetical protein
VASDRRALLEDGDDDGGGAGRSGGKRHAAAVSETLRAAKAQLSTNIDAGLEALKQLKADGEKIKEVDKTVSGLEGELDVGECALL